MSELRLIVRSNELRALLPGGEVITLHPLWLRERCRDAKNMDPKTEQRLFNPSNLATDLSIVAITTPGCGEFIVRFAAPSRLLTCSANFPSTLMPIFQ